MLGWIKKKTVSTAPPPAEAPRAVHRNAAKTADATTGTKAPLNAAAAAKESPELLAQWQARVAASVGDDAALLGIARQAPTVALKCAAIEALADEATLKLAEREFRDHDRRVHRIAKQSHDAAVGKRVARQKADGLIEAATALLGEATIPTNRLVEIDKAWQALGPALLDDTHRERFAQLSARLTELTAERAERDLRAQRWAAAAQQALAGLRNVPAPASAFPAATPTAPAGPGDLASAIALAQRCNADVPPGAATEALAARLQTAVTQALEHAAQLQARQDALAALPADSVPPESALTNEHATSPNATPADMQAQAQAQAKAQAKADAKAQAKEASAARQQERVKVATPLLLQAEDALAAGNLADTHRHLTQIDTALAGGSLPEALRARLNALQAEVARLKGWQRWGGGRARDDLVQEAQTLAAATTAALADPHQAAKLPVKQLADAIEDLRERWKELDRLGGATNQTLWRAFDAALKTCFEPVGAHLEQLKAKRKENLAARHQLIDALDAVQVEAAAPTEHAGPSARALGVERVERVERVEGVEGGEHGTQPGSGAALAIDWRDAARALAHFQTEWRKLGPAEHTVPHKSRDALLARMQTSVARIEGPLQRARDAAQRAREQLVARAVALRDEAAAHPHARDVVGRVRDLQEQWQHHARSLPLARQAENALWADFKSATDAVFTQRDAAFSARDAELLANQAGRERLIARLEGLTEQTPAAEFKRTLAEVDAEWSQAVDVPRQQVAPLDARWSAARQAAQQVLAGTAQRVRRARFGLLRDKLALCEQAEALGGVSADLAERWAQAAPLLPAWEHALASRWQRAGGAGAAPAKATTATATATATVPSPASTATAEAAALDGVLLQLEAALNMVSPADFHAARRDMKLRAMKAALEGRNATPAPSLEALAQTALRHAHPSTPQRARLQAVIDALQSNEASSP